MPQNVGFIHFGAFSYKISKIMARPIKETPVLTGEDAIRFWEAAENVVSASEEEKERIKCVYEEFQQIADFPL